jgi:hypothetical protein
MVNNKIVNNKMILDDEIGVALGVMGMSLDTYLGLTPSQFQRAYELYLEKIKSDREHAENVAWQVARWQVFRTLCPPDKKKISVFDLIELPGDKELRKPKTGKGKPVKDEARFRALAEKWGEKSLPPAPPKEG